MGAPPLDWSDLQFFLAVATGGSPSAAARSLRVDHTTVGRRVAGLEQALGVRLFDRARDGMVLTRPGHEILEQCRAMDEQAHALRRRIEGRDERLAGAVRLAAADTMATRFVMPRLRRFRERHPDVRFELVTDVRTVSLGRREADLAIRTVRPAGPDLMVRRVGTMNYAVYAAPDYAAAHGLTAGAGDSLVDFTVKGFRGLDVIGFDEGLAHLPQARWLAARLGGEPPALSSNSLQAQFQAIAGGLGVGVLPCMMAAGTDLVRLLPPGAVIGRPIFLVYHRDLRQLARLRAVADFLAAEFRAAAGMFTGEGESITALPDGSYRDKPG